MEAFSELIGKVNGFVRMVWDIADTMNGAMAIPNLIALLALSGVIVAETREFKKICAREKQADAGLSSVKA